MLRVTGHCAGNSPVTGEFPHKWQVMRKMFPSDDVINAFQERHRISCESEIWYWCFQPVQIHIYDQDIQRHMESLGPIELKLIKGVSCKVNLFNLVTSSNVTGPLWRESTDHRFRWERSLMKLVPVQEQVAISNTTVFSYFQANSQIWVYAFSHHSEIGQWSDNINLKSRDFETLWALMINRLIEYWDGLLLLDCQQVLFTPS